MEKLLRDHTSQNNRPFCSNCQKPNYFQGNCFTLRKCFNCNKKGHIAKNCKKTYSAPAKVNSLEGFTKEHLEPEQRTLIKVRVSGKPVFYLHDTGSQYTIITRKTYDSLPNKLLLSPFNSSEICFDGIVYLNFSFGLKERGTLQVEYEPVSKENIYNIFGAETENRFKSWDNNQTDNNQTVFLKCYKKNLYSQQLLSRSLKFLLYLYKILYLLKEKFLKCSIKIQTKIYLVEDSLQNKKIISLSCGDNHVVL